MGLLQPYQYLRFGLVVKFEIDNGNWVIKRDDNELRLPLETNDLYMARLRALKWIDSNYTEF